MRALTITQPWASAIALGIKTVETRSWSTPYRGALLIHAAKGFPPYAREFAETEHAIGRLPARLPLGAIVAVALLTTVQPAQVTGPILDPAASIERLYGDFTPGRWGWILRGVRPLREPVPCSGMLGLWRPSDELVQAVEDALDGNLYRWDGWGDRPAMTHDEALRRATGGSPVV